MPTSKDWLLETQHHCECGSFYEGHVCTECGLESGEQILESGSFYPYDKENKSLQHGDFRKQAVSNIAVMTKVNPNETVNQDLKRALAWDKNYGWDIVSTEIVNSKIKSICYLLNLDESFLEHCYKFFKSIRERVAFTGLRLEDIAASIVYLLLRLDGRPYSLFDFKRIDCNTKTLYRYYIKFIKSFSLYKQIKRQDYKAYIIKFINELIEDKPETYRYKFELINWVLKLYYGIFVKLVEHAATDITYYKGAGLSMIGAILYTATKNYKPFKKTQEEICNVCGCTEVTLRDKRDMLKLYLKTYESLRSPKNDQED